MPTDRIRNDSAEDTDANVVQGQLGYPKFSAWILLEPKSRPDTDNSQEATRACPALVKKMTAILKDLCSHALSASMDRWSHLAYQMVSSQNAPQHLSRENRSKLTTPH